MDVGRRSYRGRGQLDEAIKELRAGAAGRKLANVFANRDASPSPTKPSSRLFTRPTIEVESTPEEDDQMQGLEGGTIGRTRFSPATLSRGGGGRDSIYGTLSGNPNGTLSGRKSLRVKQNGARRPLSRVFLTGDRVERDD